MVKLVLSNETMVTLKRGNKTITRSQLDYETNKVMYDFRGFKPVQDVVKEVKEVKQEIIEEVKPKKRKTRKKKDEQVDLAKD
jgi:hypothetical protein|uniref:Uncharacterized protein n=1 Tax=uncultured marine virus TaxID=186617 RepID=A0A0F7L7N1_9VIRU|nr:hypothetical protein [uncultured marine virus]